MSLGPHEKVQQLNEQMRALVEDLNNHLNLAYRITSGFRAPEDNKRAGGVPNSSHEKGLALDVAHDGEIMKAMKLAYWLGRLNVIRVGFYNWHIHFDLDATKPQTQWEGLSR